MGTGIDYTITADHLEKLYQELTGYIVQQREVSDELTDDDISRYRRQ